MAGGERMRVYNNSIFQNEEFLFHIHDFELAHRQDFGPHLHQFVELVYVVRGEVEHVYKDNTSILREGDVCIIEPGVHHEYRMSGSDHFAAVNVIFQPALLAEEFSVLSKVSSFVELFYVVPFMNQTHHPAEQLRLSTHQRLEMDFLVKQLTKEYSQQHDGYRIYIKTSLIQLFVFLSRCYNARFHKPLTLHAGDQEIIDRICDYIRQHFALPLTLEQISQLCGMSLSTFKTKFKQYTGKTFVQFRNELRLATARQLLTESDDKITAIAAKAGFDDISYFNRSFKQAVGLSPGQYRKQG